MARAVARAKRGMDRLVKAATDVPDEATSAVIKDILVSCISVEYIFDGALKSL